MPVQTSAPAVQTSRGRHPERTLQVRACKRSTSTPMHTVVKASSVPIADQLARIVTGKSPDQRGERARHERADVGRLVRR